MRVGTGSSVVDSQGVRAVCVAAALVLGLASCEGCVEIAGDCEEDADCRGDELCIEGACLRACNSDLECSQREQCRDGACVPRPLGGDPAAAPDASVADQGAVDAAVTSDASMPDTAMPDTAMPDTAMPDTAVPDALQPDVGMADTGLPDTGLPDTNLPDTNLPDLWQPDAYQPDAYQPDAYQPDAYQPDAYQPDAYQPDTAVPDSYTPPDCTCLDTRDVCDGRRCERASYTCNALNLCDDGYRCESGTCVCEDRSVCGIACTDDTDCPDGNLVCETRSFCNDPLPCLENDMCDSGEICSTSSWPAPACFAAGAGQMGDDCSADDDCATGICYTQVCLEPCVINSDCPPQLACVSVPIRNGVTRLACVAASDCGSCGSGQFCDVTTCRDGCSSGADCGGGTCYLTLEHTLDMYGYCIGPSYCGAAELYAWDFNGGACVLREACWTDADCDGSYSCLTDLDAPTTTGLCGREVNFPDAGSPDALPMDAFDYDRASHDLPLTDQFTPVFDGGAEDAAASEDAA